MSSARVGRAVALWLAAASMMPQAARAAPETLPALSAVRDATTVSGISSGGYMAVQFQVSHAASVRGAGVIAGGPFGCAEGQVELALGRCMEGTPDGRALADRLTAEAHAGRIDSPRHLAGHQVWLFSGRNDGVVRRPVVRALEIFYRRHLPAERVFLQDGLPAGHVFPARSVTASCTETGGTFLADCGYDAAGELLQHLHGRLLPPAAGAPAGRLIEFDQRPFIEGGQRASGLARSGFVFVSQACAAGAACRVHIAFHGCRQNAATIGRAFVEQAGYNPWAATNGIIVLYPQTDSTWGAPFNPKGCWDWWGYTGRDYASRAGVQVRAVRAMLERLTGQRPGAAPVTATPASGAPQLAAEAADDALAVRWPAEFRASEVWLLDRGRRTLAGRPGEADLAWTIRDLAAGRDYAVEVRLHPRSPAGGGMPILASQAFRTRSPAPDCDTYFSDNMRHVTRGRATPWWGRALAVGSGDDLGWWAAWSESQVTRTASGFERGGCR